MTIHLFSKSWDKQSHEQVMTYRNIALTLRNWSLHCEYSFDVDGWSLGLGWLQISWGVFSEPINVPAKPLSQTAKPKKRKGLYRKNRFSF